MPYLERSAGLKEGEDGWREDVDSKSERMVGAGELVTERESREGERKVLSCMWAVLDEVEDGQGGKLVGRGESHCCSCSVVVRFSPRLE